MSIKALANKVLERNSEGNRKETQSFPDRKLGKPQFPCKETGNSPDCFSPDGTLELAFMEALDRGWTDNRFLECIAELIQDGCLLAPWGFLVRNSLVTKGDYWILSDTTARERIPAGVFSFTIEELRPIVETSKVFKGARVVKVIRPKVKGAVNA